MRFSGTGKITENFYVLGNAQVPIYLLDGVAPVLFEAGLTALSGFYEEDIRKVLKGRAPAYLFLTHSHFDHIGAASRLKALWPRMRIVGFSKVGEILARPGAVDLIRTLNREAAEFLFAGRQEVDQGLFEPFALDMVLRGGEVIELGNDRIEVIQTPGHTWDFLSYWVPEKRILVASEAAGGSDPSGHVFTEFLVDVEAYRNSLNALSLLDAKVMCLGHWVVITEGDVKRHIARSIEGVARYVAMAEECLRLEQGDIEKAALRVKAAEWDPRPWPKQPEHSYLLNTQARVKTVRDRMQRAEQL